jgi:hypothetical protein
MADQQSLDSARRVFSDSDRIQSVHVIGAGWVGRQIVGQLAAYEIPVAWSDRDPAALKDGLGWIGKHAEDLVQQGVWPSHAKNCTQFISIGSLDELKHKAVDLAIETVTEQVSVKKRVLGQASQVFAPRVIIRTVPTLHHPFWLHTFRIPNDSRIFIFMCRSGSRNWSIS